MTEQTPEKVADLIARASGRVRAHAEFSRRMGGQGLRLTKLYEEHAELATALEVASAERDEALAVIAELQKGIQRFDAVAYYAEAREILSRIPEHPKED